MDNTKDRAALAQTAALFARLLPVADANPQEKVPNPFNANYPDPQFVKHASSLAKYLSTMLLFMTDDWRTVRGEKQKANAGISEVSLLEGEELIDDIKHETGSPQGKLDFKVLASDIIMEQRERTWGYKDTFWTMARHLMDALNSLTGKDYVSALDDEPDIEENNLRQDQSIRRKSISVLRDSLNYIKNHSHEIREITEGFDYYLDSPEFREDLDYVTTVLESDRKYNNPLFDMVSTFCEAVYGRPFVDTIVKGGYIDSDTGQIIGNTAFAQLTGDGSDVNSRKKKYDYLGRIDHELTDLALENMQDFEQREDKRLSGYWWHYSSELKNLFDQNSSILRAAGLRDQALEDALRIDSDLSKVKNLGDDDRRLLEKNREKLSHIVSTQLDDRADHYFSALENLACRIYVQIGEILSERNHHFSSKREMSILNAVSSKLQNVYGFEPGKYGKNAHRLLNYDWDTVQSYLIRSSGYKASITLKDRSTIEAYKEKYHTRTAIAHFLYDSMDSLTSNKGLLDLSSFKQISEIGKALLADYRFKSALEVMNSRTALDNTDRQNLEKRATSLKDVAEDIGKLKKALESEFSFSKYYEDKANSLESRRKEMLLPSSKAIGTFIKSLIATSSVLANPTDGVLVVPALVSLFGSIVPESWMKDRLKQLSDIPGNVKTLVSDVSMKVRQAISGALNTYVKEGAPRRDDLVSQMGEACASFVLSQLEEHNDIARQRRNANILSQKTYTMGADGKPRLSADDKISVQDVFRTKILRNEDISEFYSALGNKARLTDELGKLNDKYGVFVDMQDIEEISAANRSEAAFNNALSDRIAYRFAEDEFVRMAGSKISRTRLASAIMDSIDIAGITEEIHIHQAKTSNLSVKDISPYIPEILREHVSTSDFNNKIQSSAEGVVQTYFRPICEKIADSMSVEDVKDSMFAQQFSDELKEVVKAYTVIDSVLRENNKSPLELPSVEKAFTVEGIAAYKAQESYRNAMVNRFWQEANGKKVVSEKDREQFEKTVSLLYDSIADQKKYESATSYLNNSRADNSIYFADSYQKTISPSSYNFVRSLENGALGPISIEDFNKGIREYISRSASSPEVETTLDSIGKYIALLSSANANENVVQSYMKLTDDKLYDPAKRIESNNARIRKYEGFINQDNLARKQYKRAEKVLDIVYNNCKGITQDRDNALRACAVSLKKASDQMLVLEEDSFSGKDVQRLVKIHKALSNHIQMQEDEKYNVRRPVAFTSEEDVRTLADNAKTADLIHTLHEARESYGELVKRFDNTSEFSHIFKDDLQIIDRYLDIASENQLIISCDNPKRLQTANNEVLSIAAENYAEDKAEIARLNGILEKAALENMEVSKDEYVSFAKLKGVGKPAKTLIERSLDNRKRESYLQARYEYDTSFTKYEQNMEDHNGKSHSMQIREDYNDDNAKLARNYLVHGNDEIEQDIIDVSVGQVEIGKNQARHYIEDIKAENEALKNYIETIGTMLPMVAVTSSSLVTDKRTFSSEQMGKFKAIVNAENSNVLLESGKTIEEKMNLLETGSEQYRVISEDLQSTEAAIKTAEMSALTRCALTNETANLNNILSRELKKEPLLYIAENAKTIFDSAIPSVSDKMVKDFTIRLQFTEKVSKLLKSNSENSFQRDYGNRGPNIATLDSDDANKALKDIRKNSAGKKAYDLTRDGEVLFFGSRLTEAAKRVLADQFTTMMEENGSKQYKSAIEEAFKVAMEKQNYSSHVLAAQEQQDMEEVEHGV